jgi:3'(2'), 5'-bisphosphate nucleotidase
MNLQELGDLTLRLADAAAVAIMDVYRRPFATETKQDGSPVTAADLAADTIICDGLAAMGIPVVSEERVARGVPDLSGGLFWLVDPLDGTREFVQRNGEFTVNIALIRDRMPVLGCVGVPARGTRYLGIAGQGAWRENGGRQRIAARRPPADPVALASRNHRDPETERFLQSAGVARIDSAGSALKFCLIAEGAADLYPRFGPTSEWDTAAGHALVLAAGGRMSAWDGGVFAYGKPRFLNNGFVARGAA